MRDIVENNKGFVSVFFCISLPLIIAIMGFCIDGSLLLYYDARLMTATKFASISATSYYDIIDDKLVINATDAEDAAILALDENFEDAKLVNFTVDSDSQNECTVKAEVEVPFFFMKIFGVKAKVISESYTSSRNIK